MTQVVTDYEAAWKKLRTKVRRERQSYAATNEANKEALAVYAALEGAYGGVLRMMDKLEGKR